MERKELDRLWSAINKTVKSKLSTEQAKKWEITVDCYIEEINDRGEMVLGSTNVFSQLMIGNANYTHILEESINEITGTNYKVVVKSIERTKRDKEIGDKFDYEHGIKGNKTFSNYVVAPSNSLIVKACVTVSEQFSAQWSPLFIYGKSGIGKTHLLQAIGHNSLSTNPNNKVKYINAYDFIGVVQRIGTGSNPSEGYQRLRNELESYHLLLLDDVQILADKDKSKEILFNTFRHYDDNDKQIVITSDVPPEELRGFEARLVTRFKSNLSLKLTPPDAITSREILENKIKLDGTLSKGDIDPLVIEFIAQNFSTDVRSLEGALSSLTFWAINNNRESISSEDIPLIFQHLKSSKATININKIIIEVARYYSLDKKDIPSASRTKKVVTARHISVYLMRDILNSTYTEIGSKLGGRDHSTIMSSHKKIEKELKTNEGLSTVINELRAKILA